MIHLYNNTHIQTTNGVQTTRDVHNLYSVAFEYGIGLVPMGLSLDGPLSVATFGSGHTPPGEA